jgi:hypothetical protein
MTLHARWYGTRRQAESPPDPHYPLGMLVDGTGGRPSCSVSLTSPAPCIGEWFIRCDQCGMTALVTAAGRADDPHTVRLPCKPMGTA